MGRVLIIGGYKYINVIGNKIYYCDDDANTNELVGEFINGHKLKGTRYLRHILKCDVVKWHLWKRSSIRNAEDLYNVCEDKGVRYLKNGYIYQNGSIRIRVKN